MALIDDIRTLQADTVAAMTELSSDVDDLIGRISGGLSAAEAAEVVADMTTVRDALRSTADKWTPPAPEPDPNA